MNTNIRKLTLAAMFAALAFALAALSNIAPIPLVPALPFLNYDPKDVLIAIASFVIGPIYAMAISLITALLEMLTVSSTGLIGMIMNFLSSSIFAGIAALVYRYKHNIYGAIAGLFCSSILTTAFMLAWNYLVSPYYMGVSREAISAMLVPGFLPFNLIKSALNSGLTLLLYKPLTSTLRSLNLLDADVAEFDLKKSSIVSLVSVIVGLLLIASAIFATLTLA